MTLKSKPKVEYDWQVPYSLDGYLRNFVEKIRKLKEKDWDIVICVDGKERSGKSKFSQILGYAIDQTLDLKHITLTPKEFYQEVVTAEKGQVVIMDEGLTAFFSRASMTSTNISLVRMLAECGQKNLVVIVVLPTFFVLDSYLALHRTSCLFHIYTDRAQTRGFFRFYDKRRKKKLYIYGKQTHEYVKARPNFYGRFVNYQFPWEEAYRKKKHDSLVAAFDKGKQVRLEKQIDLEKDAIIIFEKNKDNKLSNTDLCSQLRELGHRFGNTKAIDIFNRLRKMEKEVKIEKIKVEAT